MAADDAFCYCHVIRECIKYIKENNTNLLATNIMVCNEKLKYIIMKLNLTLVNLIIGIGKKLNDMT